MVSARSRKRKKKSQIRKIKRILFIALPALVLLSVILMLFLSRPEMPNMIRINSTLKALRLVRHLDAKVYATELFQQVEKRWDTLLLEWRRENRKCFFKRDFARLDSLAEKTLQSAQLCAAQAQIYKDSLKNAVQLQSVLIKIEVENFKKHYREMPIGDSLRDKLLASEMLISESQAAFDRQEYKKAHHKIMTATSLIGQSQQAVSSLIQRYLTNIPNWNKWIEETIGYSRDNRAAAIIIDKLNHQCRVYDNGNLTMTFTTEFGPNWIGHKRARGDDATPEGRYFVKKKKSRSQTQYYLALEIDYPNASDQERFNTAKKNGELPKNAQIGGLIEIHGGGGEGVNWTNGCVALKNHDMEKIYKLAAIGTPITIVGTMTGTIANHKTPFIN